MEMSADCSRNFADSSFRLDFFACLRQSSSDQVLSAKPAVVRTVVAMNAEMRTLVIVMPFRCLQKMNRCVGGDKITK